MFRFWPITNRTHRRATVVTFSKLYLCQSSPFEKTLFKRPRVPWRVWVGKFQKRKSQLGLSQTDPWVSLSIAIESEVSGNFQNGSCIEILQNSYRKITNFPESTQGPGDKTTINRFAAHCPILGKKHPSFNSIGFNQLIAFQFNQVFLRPSSARPSPQFTSRSGLGIETYSRYRTLKNRNSFRPDLRKKFV